MGAGVRPAFADNVPKIVVRGQHHPRERPLPPRLPAGARAGRAGGRLPGDRRHRRAGVPGGMNEGPRSGRTIYPQRLTRVTRRTVTVNDKMQRGYRYELAEPAGRNFDPEFSPELTPREMLRLGVFCGKYMTDCRRNFPASWFARAKLAPGSRDRALNYFGVDASQPLSDGAGRAGSIQTIPAAGSSGTAATTWAAACPRRTARQIKRWKAIRRHVRQIQTTCEPGDIFAASASARPCCTGPTTAGNCDICAAEASPTHTASGWASGAALAKAGRAQHAASMPTRRGTSERSVLNRRAL